MHAGQHHENNRHILRCLLGLAQAMSAHRPHGCSYMQSLTGALVVKQDALGPRRHDASEPGWVSSYSMLSLCKADIRRVTGARTVLAPWLPGPGRRCTQRGHAQPHAVGALELPVHTTHQASLPGGLQLPGVLKETGTRLAGATANLLL